MRIQKMFDTLLNTDYSFKLVEHYKDAIEIMKMPTNKAKKYALQSFMLDRRDCGGSDDEFLLKEVFFSDRYKEVMK